MQGKLCFCIPFASLSPKSHEKFASAPTLRPGEIRLKKTLRFQRELLAVLLSFDRRVFSSRDYLLRAKFYYGYQVGAFIGKRLSRNSGRDLKYASSVSVHIYASDLSNSVTRGKLIYSLSNHLPSSFDVDLQLKFAA